MSDWLLHKAISEYGASLIAHDYFDDIVNGLVKSIQSLVDSLSPTVQLVCKVIDNAAIAVAETQDTNSKQGRQAFYLSQKWWQH